MKEACAKPTFDSSHSSTKPKFSCSEKCDAVEYSEKDFDINKKTGKLRTSKAQQEQSNGRCNLSRFSLKIG